MVDDRKQARMRAREHARDALYNKNCTGKGATQSSLQREICVHVHVARDLLYCLKHRRSDDLCSLVKMRRKEQA